MKKEKKDPRKIFINNQMNLIIDNIKMSSKLIFKPKNINKHD